MKHAKLLDCTLRDGAYLINKDFGCQNIEGIINGLVKARVDYIEIGFFEDCGYTEGRTVFKNSKEAKQFIPQDKNNCKFTVLADYSRYNVENLDYRIDSSIDAVRECFLKHERFEAIEYCKVIKEKGYELFVQPVDILGYTEFEMIEFINLINEVEPYCLSIVDTFGSMYSEDLKKIFTLIHNKLIPSCKIGFHSHNNMQMSNALSQEFLNLTWGKREVVIDGTIYGMGRGAGNTPTELIAQYMINKLNYNYDIDELLDLIDNYIENIKTRCTWGYSAPNFIAGCYDTHVNNLAYLNQKNGITSKDIRHILNRMDYNVRKKYDYDRLEKTYMDYLTESIDDTQTIKLLKSIAQGKKVLIIAPGKSVENQKKEILEYIKKSNYIIIAINFDYKDFKSDFVYMNNIKRYNVWKNKLSESKFILTSNIHCEQKDNINIVSFQRLAKCGWSHFDNSMIMILRLLDFLEPACVDIVGFDGYSNFNNYVNKDLAIANFNNNLEELNIEIQDMLDDYMAVRTCTFPINIITKSIFKIKEVKVFEIL
ncbi:MAG: aldolase catalytic domain-containing protein [Clostridia bacterium]